MNKVWLVVPTALAVAALVLVIVQRGEVRQLKRQLASAKSGEAADAPAADRDTQRRLTSLERTVARLFDMRLASRNTAGTQANGSSNQAAGKDDGLSQNADALLTGEALKTDQGRQRLQEIVREVQEQTISEQRQQREQWQEQARQEKLQLFAKRANLNANQVEQISQLLNSELQQRRDLRQAAQQGQKPFADFKAEAKSMREASDKKAREILDDKQYSEYQKFRGAGRHAGRRPPQAVRPNQPAPRPQ